MFLIYMYMGVHTTCISVVCGSVHWLHDEADPQQRPALVLLSRDLVVALMHTFSDFFSLV